MIDRSRLGTLAIVVLVALAGCSAGLGGSGDGGDGSAPANDEQTGTLAFYLSDQPAAIEEFDALEVTVTEIGVHRAGDGGSDTNGSEEPPATATDTTNGTATDGGANATATSTPANESAEADDADVAGWVTHEVENATVDLTELQGANATLIANLSLPAGEYDAVYVAVSNVSGTLATGEAVNVKLPSDRLRINQGFSLGPNRSTSFVFDVAVHRAGGSGKYVLRPVISQSGTDVEIRDVDRERSRPGPGANASNGGGGPPDDGAPGQADRNRSDG